MKAPHEHLVRRYLGAVIRGKPADPLFTAVCALNGVGGIMVASFFFTMDMQPAIWSSVIFVLMVSGFSFGIYIYGAALSYQITCAKMNDALRMVEAGRVREASRILLEFGSPFNPHLMLLPSIAYLFGRALAENGDARGDVFIQYALGRAPVLQETNIAPVTLRREFSNDLTVVSKKFIFRAIDAYGLFKIMVWFVAGIALLRLVLLLWKILQ